MDITKPIARGLFELSCLVGRPIGGLRPHRFVHLLAQHGFGDTAPSPEQFRWVRDNFGSEFLVHPYYLIDRYILAFGSYESALHRYIGANVCRGATCLDVGANTGAISLHLGRKVGPEGKVHCFEPVPHILERLRRNIEKNFLADVIQAHGVALSDRVGKQDMALATKSHTNQGMSSLVEFGHGDLTERATIATTTLDSFVAEHEITSVDFIKIDIQGAEPFFLKGAHNTLQSFGPQLIMEMAPGSLADAGYTNRDLVEMLHSLNYEIFELSDSGKRGAVVDSQRCDDSTFSANVLCLRKD